MRIPFANFQLTLFVGPFAASEKGQRSQQLPITARNRRKQIQNLSAAKKN